MNNENEAQPQAFTCPYCNTAFSTSTDQSFVECPKCGNMSPNQDITFTTQGHLECL